MPTVEVYLRGSRAVAQPFHELPSRLTVAGTACEVFDWGETTDAELGAIVRAVLDVAMEPLDERPADAMKAVARALGARSGSALGVDVRSVSVAPYAGRLEVVPMVNEGTGRGFLEDDEHMVALENPSDAELGAAVRAGMDDARGAAKSAEEPRTDESPALLRDLVGAADWISEALRHSGYDADWSPASLREVDRFFDDHLRRPGKPRRGSLLAEDLGLRLFALGGYVGEVLRRSAGGRWRADEQTAEDAVELELPDGSIVWPVRRVMARFERGAEEGIAAYGAALLDTGASPSGAD